MKRKNLIEILKQLNPLIIENNGPTQIFIAGKDNKKVNISALSVDKDFIIVTTGKYLFKRKYRINRNELGKPFVFLDRGRAIERKLQYQMVWDCGESECQQDESSGKKITRWIGFDNSLERGQTSTWSST